MKKISKQNTNQLRFGRMITTKKAVDDLIEGIGDMQTLEEFIGFFIDAFRLTKNIPIKEIIKMLERLVKMFKEVEREMKKKY